jgi:hypothetical protein
VADATGCTGTANGAALLKRMAVEVAWDVSGWDMTGWVVAAGAGGCDTLEACEAGDAIRALGFKGVCGGG